MHADTSRVKTACLRPHAHTPTPTLTMSHVLLLRCACSCALAGKLTPALAASRSRREGNRIRMINRCCARTDHLRQPANVACAYPPEGGRICMVHSGLFAARPTAASLKLLSSARCTHARAQCMEHVHVHADKCSVALACVAGRTWRGDGSRHAPTTGWTWERCSTRCAHTHLQTHPPVHMHI